MHVEWYGQSAFHLSGGERPVAIDPFADMSALAAGRGMQFDYPPIDGVGGRPAAGDPRARSTTTASRRSAGTPRSCARRRARLESPIGEVTAIASEHDEQAGTERGPNTIFVFTTRRRCASATSATSASESCATSRPQPIGDLDLLIVPVGGGPTIGAAQATAIVERLSPRWVVPMHYRTPRIDFLETADDFLERFAHVERLSQPAFDTASLPRYRRPPDRRAGGAVAGTGTRWPEGYNQVKPGKDL